MSDKLQSVQASAKKPFNPLDNKIYADLGNALIRLSMHDGDEASQVLSVKLSNINAQLNSLKIKIEEGMDTDSMIDNVDIALQEIIPALLQLQFFDRITQRLDHAAQSIECLTDPADAIDNPMSNRFTMEDERILYNALLDGDDISSAVSKASEKLDKTLDKSEGDDIELF